MRRVADRACAVLFDLDGTLIDSAPEIHAAVNRALATEGLPQLTATQVRGFIGSGVGVLLSRCLAAFGKDADGPQHTRLMATFLADYETRFALTTLYPGVASMLEALAASGHPMGICTNKPEGPTRAVLRHFNLNAFFPVVVGGDTLPQRKPDPIPLRHAHAQIGGGPALFVGDSEIDAETAHATPLPFALFTGGYRTTPVADLAPIMAFDDHAALPHWLAQHHI
jgi:phosphoglycolate phosphatase